MQAFRSSWLGMLVRQCSISSSSLKKQQMVVISGANKNSRFEAQVANMSSLTTFYLKHKVAKIRLAKLFLEHPSLLEVSQEKLDKLSDFFKELHIDNAGIAKMIQHCPKLVEHELESMRRTFCYYKSLGLESSTLSRMVVREPALLKAGIEVDLQAKVEYLLNLGFSEEGIAKLLAAWPRLATVSLEKELEPNVELLIASGLEGYKLEHVVLKYPLILLQKVEHSAQIFKDAGLEGRPFQKMLTWHPRAITVSEDDLHGKEDFLLRLGFEKGTKMFGTAFGFVVTVDKDVLEARVDRFLQYGISREGACAIIRRQPGVLIVSDSVLENKIRFILDSMKFSLEELVECPKYLSYSVEKRFKPRLKLLSWMRSQGFLTRKYALATVLFCSNDEFVKVFSKYHPDAAGLYDAFRYGSSGQVLSQEMP